MAASLYAAQISRSLFSHMSRAKIDLVKVVVPYTRINTSLSSCRRFEIFIHSL